MSHLPLEAYAARRFGLSGTSIVRSHYPYCQPVDCLGGTSDSDAPLVSFAHYDYLGLANDVRLRTAAASAASGVGVGAGASRLVGGELSVHRDLERDLAQFLGVEDTLTLVSGYGTNVSLIAHLMMKGDLVVVDECAHNSIMVGTQLSRATTCTFRHNDLEHLSAILRQHGSRQSRMLVVVEGLYSMDGDLPDLPRLLHICRAYGAWLMIDEAHSVGVLGCGGRGIAEHFGVALSEIDIVVGTLSKAFVACGGFVAARKGVIDWLRFTLPGFVYSVAMPPPSVATAQAALTVLRQEPERLARLAINSRYFHERARNIGFDVGHSVGLAVIPIVLRDTATALAAGKAALAAGYLAPPIVQIAVPKELPRLRFFIRADHTARDIDGVLEALRPFAGRPVQEADFGQMRVASAGAGCASRGASVG